MITKFAGAVVCAASFTVLAQEAPEVASEAEVETEELELREDKAWSLGVDLDWFTAYIWHNAVQNSRMVLQPCIWGEYQLTDMFSVGGYYWQNWDLTGHRRDIFGTGLTEQDYNIHAGLQAWASEEEDYKLDFELGHEWFTYPNVRRSVGYPKTNELYLKATFENPFVTAYAQTSWMYADFGDYQDGFHYEVGFTKEAEVTDEITVGADWNVSMANHAYQDFLYGMHSSGLSGTTLKLYGTYAITETASFGATIAYTGVLNGDARDQMDEMGSDYDLNGHKYPRDLLWGGISFKIEF